MTPQVIDISHHNTVTDLAATAAAEVWGVIHKCTQGSGYRDPDYAARRAMASAAGMLWGAYHFNDGSDVSAQVDNFITTAKPDDSTLLVLDFEDNPKSNMSIASAVQFLRLAEQRMGRKLTIYSGNRLKENIGKLSPSDHAYLCEHPLWLCQYGPTPKMPPGFSSTFLWQYSDGVVGPGPHGVPGVHGEVDLNAFNGTRDQLTAMWVGDATARRSPQSSHSVRAGDDQLDVPMQMPRPRPTDDGSDLPPFLRQRAAPKAGGPNVQQPRAKFSVSVRVVQEELDKMGYHEVGDVDGLWGGKTAAAIKAFFIDRGVVQADGTPAVAEVGQVLYDEIGRAKSDLNPDGTAWSRPIAPSRANAQPKDVAPKIEAVRVSLWSKLCAQIAAAAAALGVGGSSISQVYSSAQGALSPVHDALKYVPPEAWLGILGLASGLVWYATSRTANAATKDYNTGRTN